MTSTELKDVVVETPSLTTERPIDAIRGLPAVEELPPAPKRLRPRTSGSRREQRSIARVRSAMAKLLEDNAPRFQEWLAKAAEDNPLKAMVLMKDLCEFYMPKLGRVEQTGEVTHKVQHFVAVTEREAPPAVAGPAAIDGEFTSLDEVKR